MSYSVYIKYRGKNYKLPVNPEEIKKTQKLNVEKYQVLGSGQVSVPSYQALHEYSFECELPHQEMHYMEPGGRADPDWYLSMLTNAQKRKEPVRLIYSNGMTDDESTEVLVESCTVAEKSGEEGDKYLSLSFLQYREPQKKYRAVVKGTEAVAQPQAPRRSKPDRRIQLLLATLCGRSRSSSMETEHSTRRSSVQIQVRSKIRT